MLIRKAYKFKLMPNGEQRHKLSSFVGCKRFVFNMALEKQIALHGENSTFLTNYFQMTNWLIAWKKEFPWLRDCHSQVLQQGLKDLHQACQNFLAKRACFPKFKCKDNGDGARFPQGGKVDEANSRVYLPKIDWVRYRKSREIEGTIKNITVSKAGDDWFVSIQTEFEVDNPVPTGGELGIDVGIARIVTCSDGTFFAPLDPYKHCMDRLARLQQELEKKVRFSKNWQRVREQINKLYTKIANIRKNYLHQISSAISKNHAIVFVEDLKIKNLTKSAKGTVEEPGKNVKAKSGLNRAILDQGWGMFFRFLNYKLAWKGGHMIAVPPQNTSRTCPRCGHVSKESRPIQAKFLCTHCGLSGNADVFAAMNILERGRQMLATEHL